MTKFFTTRSLVALTGLLLMGAIFSFSGKNRGATGLEAEESRVSIDNQDENELFWETLSRQFSGTVSTY